MRPTHSEKRRKQKHWTLQCFMTFPKIIHGKGSFSKQQTEEIHCPPRGRIFFPQQFELHSTGTKTRTRAAAFFQAIEQTNTTTLGNAGAPRPLLHLHGRHTVPQSLTSLLSDSVIADAPFFQGVPPFAETDSATVT